jgi:hypothetical protein
MAEKNVPGGFLGAGGLQLPDIDPVETLAATYAVGAASAAQTMTLLDAKGGTIVMDGTGLTGAFPYTLSLLGNQFLSQSLAVGVNVGVVPTARIHVAGGSLNAGSASLKLDQGFLMTVAEPGAIESDGTDLWWTDSGSIRRKLTVQTLANAYDMGAAAVDQTLILTNAKGGAFIINATTPGPGFTGVTAFEVNVIGGSTNFYTKGGFDTSSAFSVVSAAGAVWDSIKVAASTLTLTGAVTPVTALSMTTIAAPTITSASAIVVTSAATLSIAGAPIAAGSTTITTPYALWVQAGNSKFDANVLVGGDIGATAAKTIALSNSATAPTTTVDLCHLYSADIAAGRATLAIFTEEAVTADIGLASTHSHVIFINGVKYKLMLVAA